MSCAVDSAGWVARYTSPDTGANVQLVTRHETAPDDAVVSVHTPDVDGAYEEAQRPGYETVYPLTTSGAASQRDAVSGG